MGPGGALQWHPLNNSNPNIMMMTTDIALLHDPIYLKLVRHYASGLRSLEKDFAYSWYVLTSRDMGPATRCCGSNVPPPQLFQNPLPPSPPANKLIDFNLVTKQILRIINKKNAASIPDAGPNGISTYGPLFINLAWKCASTWRMTDYTGEKRIHSK